MHAYRVRGFRVFFKCRKKCSISYHCSRVMASEQDIQFATTFTRTHFSQWMEKKVYAIFCSSGFQIETNYILDRREWNVLQRSASLPPVNDIITYESGDERKTVESFVEATNEKYHLTWDTDHSPNEITESSVMAQITVAFRPWCSRELRQKNILHAKVCWGHKTNSIILAWISSFLLHSKREEKMPQHFWFAYPLCKHR